MKTNKSNFAYFSNRCTYYINLFGLSDWRVYYTHMLETDAYATCNLDLDNRVATINLSTDIDPEYQEDKSKIEIRLNEFAFHEVCHLLLADICKCNSSSRIGGIEHSVIRRLEKAFGLY